MYKMICLLLTTVMFILVVSRPLSAMSCHGDAGNNTQTQATQMNISEHSSMVHTAFVSQEAVNVGNKICPVSGEKVGQDGMEPVTYEYEGKIYNFCCASCIDEFKKDPKKYIKIIEAEKNP